MRWLIAIALCFVVAATASAQAVHVDAISGDAGGRLREALVHELDARGLHEGSGVTVRGRYRASRGLLLLSVESDGTRGSLRVQNRARAALAAAAAGQIQAFLGAPREAAPSGAPLPDMPYDDDDEQPVPPPPGHAARPVRARPTATGADPARSLLSAQPALRTWVGLQAFTRRLSFTDDIFHRLGTYEVAPGLAAHAGFEWYPLRHVSHEAWANVGVSGFVRAMAVDSSYDRQGAAYGTHASAWELDLRYALPIDSHSITAGVAYGEESYTFDQPQVAGPGHRDNLGPVPGVDYRYLRPFAQAEVLLFEGLSIGASFGGRLLLATGDFGSQWFPHSSGAGLDFGAFVAYRVAWFCEVRLSGEHHRYFFAINPRPHDTFVAGGALDEWFSLTLDGVIRIPQ